MPASVLSRACNAHSARLPATRWASRFLAINQADKSEPRNDQNDEFPNTVE